MLPAGTPAWITAERVAYTQRVWDADWRREHGRGVSAEEAIEMIRTVGRLGREMVKAVRESRS